MPVDSLLQQLRQDLAERRMVDGMGALEAERALLDGLSPAQPGAGVLTGYVALWVDAGYAAPSLLASLLERFPRPVRPALPVADYLHLRIAEGLAALSAENIADALRHFQFVLASGEEICDPELLAIGNFWLGRALRREGRYDDALLHTERALALALECGHPRMAAVMQVMRSWLVFQKGRLKEATRILEDAEAALEGTDDCITLGNIHSAYGRIARREGRYDAAQAHFAKAIEWYRRHDPQHPNLGRCLLNTAFVKRLIAVRLKDHMDRALARRRAAGAAAGASPAAEQRAAFDRVRVEALQDLAAAEAIYQRHHNYHGIGSVRLNYGFLSLDAGDLDCAAAEAAEGFRFAEEKKDAILMARARILQCMVELAREEEQIEAEPGRHAQAAQAFARDAVEIARQTQNTRLLARAYVWQGLAWCGEHRPNLEAARECCDAARALLKPGGQDYLSDDLQALQSRLVRSGRVDTLLRQWSEGLVGDKTFQQLADDFAAVIIPKVWEREDRKISRVAARLSISPKKVRRILQAAGLHGVD